MKDYDIAIILKFACLLHRFMTIWTLSTLSSQCTINHPSAGTNSAVVSHFLLPNSQVISHHAMM